MAMRVANDRCNYGLLLKAVSSGVEDDPPTGKNRCLVTNREHFIKLMGNKHNPDLPFDGYPLYFSQQLLGLVSIQRCGGFIQEKKPRFAVKVGDHLDKLFFRM